MIGGGPSFGPHIVALYETEVEALTVTVKNCFSLKGHIVYR